MFWHYLRIFGGRSSHMNHLNLENRGSKPRLLPRLVPLGLYCPGPGVTGVLGSGGIRDTCDTRQNGALCGRDLDIVGLPSVDSGLGAKATRRIMGVFRSGRCSGRCFVCLGTCGLRPSKQVVCGSGGNDTSGLFSYT